MSKAQNGFSALEGLLIIIIVALVGFVGWYVFHSKNAADFIYNSSSSINNTAPLKPKTTNPVSSSPSTPSQLAEIKNSGSTNSPGGWDLVIYSDGSGKIVGSKTFASNTFNASALKQALETTDLSNFQGNCARSASFGSVETLIYNNQTTRGIDCLIDGQPQSSLSTQLSAAITKAGL